jgi:ABC-type dipeptide/oligopeptide/nickel transport system permease subunit
MTDQMELDAPITEVAPRASEWRRFAKSFLGRWLVLIGLVAVVATILLATLAPVITPYDPTDQDLTHRLAQPSAQHILGTDNTGRDTFSRIAYGARTSLLVALGSLVVASVLGVALGSIAGYFGGWTFTIIMRLTDALMAFPTILLAMAIAGLLGGGVLNIVMAIGVSNMSSFCRLMCGQVLSVKENDYIKAARSIGVKDSRVIIEHVIPNSFPPIIVQISLMLGHAILAEAGLSFIGVGIKPPTPSWGSMIADGYKYLASNPVLSMAPGIACMLCVFGFNMLGDGLRDALDPRLKGRI